MNGHPEHRHDPGEVAVAKIAGYVPISADLAADGAAFGQAWWDYQQMTPEQRQAAGEQAKQARAAERAAAEQVPLTLDALLNALGWSRAYAEHAVQPYCRCYDSPDGWDTCQHADDEGITR